MGRGDAGRGRKSLRGREEVSHYGSMMSKRNRRALFIQYVNPAVYPPLEHSSRILAGLGWDVRFLGIDGATAAELAFPSHPQIDVRGLPNVEPGWRQKLHYLRYAAWCLWHSRVWRPDLIYVSDIFAAPVGVIVGSGRVVYHEHDWPASGSSLFYRMCASARARLLRSAARVIAPNEERLRWMAPGAPSAVVWNCPRQEEIAPPRKPFHGPLRILYQGSINDSLLPLHLLRALAAARAEVHLDVVGYETVGSRGYMREFLALASALGIADRVAYHGAVPRSQLSTYRAACHLGLSIMPSGNENRNFAAMVGASNKFFDYLAGGLCPIVSNLPEWGEVVDAGVAVSCDAESIPDLSHLIEWCAAHPEACREIGERGRRRVLEEWNYETQFRPVVSYLHASPTHFHASA